MVARRWWIDRAVRCEDRRRSGTGALTAPLAERRRTLGRLAGWGWNCHDLDAFIGAVGMPGMGRVGPEGNDITLACLRRSHRGSSNPRTPIQDRPRDSTYDGRGCGGQR